MHRISDIHYRIFASVLTKVKVFNIQVQSLEGRALILASVITIILMTRKENNYYVKSAQKTPHNAFQGAKKVISTACHRVLKCDVIKN